MWYPEGLNRRAEFFAKQRIMRALCNKRMNTVAVAWLKHIRKFIPDKFTTRMPIVGKVFVQLPDRRCLVMETDGRDLIARDLFWGGFKGFEPETAKLFYKLAENSNVTFDIGANVGYYTLLAAIANERGQVYAFEPVPEIYEWLKRNIALNSISNVIAVPSAVTKFDGDITLYVPADNGYDVIPSSASTLEGFVERPIGISVAATSLDSFAHKGKVEKVDLIKIDTDG